MVREFETERAALVRKAEDDTRNSRFVNILFKTFHALFPVSGAARDIGLRPTPKHPAARERKTFGIQGKENSGNFKILLTAGFATCQVR